MRKKTYLFSISLIIIILVVFHQSLLADTYAESKIISDLHSNTKIIKSIDINNEKFIFYSYTKKNTLSLEVYKKNILGRYEKVKHAYTDYFYITDAFTYHQNNKVSIAFTVCGLNLNNKISYFELLIGDKKIKEVINDTSFLKVYALEFDPETISNLPTDLRFFDNKNIDITSELDYESLNKIK